MFMKLVIPRLTLIVVLCLGSVAYVDVAAADGASSVPPGFVSVQKGDQSYLTNSTDAFEIYRAARSAPDNGKRIRLYVQLRSDFGDKIIIFSEGNSVTYGQLAKESLSWLYCKPNESQEGASSRTALVGAIRRAVEDQKPSKLLPYLKCAFYVDIDAPQIRDRNMATFYAIGPIMYFGHEVEWSAVDLSIGAASAAGGAPNDLFVPSLGAVFYLNKVGNQGWYLTGVKGRGKFMNELLRVIED